MEDATHHSHPHNSVRNGLAFIVKLKLHLSIQLHKCPTADLHWSFIEITTTKNNNMFFHFLLQIIIAILQKEKR